MLWAQIQWGGEDPTAIAWSCTIAYVLAGVGCCVVGVRSHSAPDRLPAVGGVWVVLGLLLILLGVNKESDLQTVVVHFGRDQAHALGLYAFKRQIGAGFSLVVMAFAVGAIWHERRRLVAFATAYPLASSGLGLISVYTVIRFFTILHLGPQWFLKLEDAPAFIALELVGSLLILWAAMKAMRELKVTTRGS